MSSQSLVVPAKKPRLPARPSLAPGWLDPVLVAAFLALGFLLGAFPLKDTDFWWHLRTGDLIRQTGQVPHHDLYTYTAANHPWVDLHWGFQVLLSWGYAHGGVVALALAKCTITCLALLLLVTARWRQGPVWVLLLAWLPALLVLGGRMYIRPETLTLLYLAIDLAIVCRWERHPALAFLLPVVQVAWVNTQGLFVFGPFLVVLALVDALFRPGALAPGRKRWWRLAGAAAGLTALACLANPYGLRGALFPLSLARTMANPLFAQKIAELTPIPLFIQRSAGWHSLPLQLHLATMALGALSFLIPVVWSGLFRIRAVREKGQEKAGQPARRRRKTSTGSGEPAWRLSTMRLVLFLAFSALSWRATRNSHQFAAVVGTVTAWNFADWAAALGAGRRATSTTALVPRIGALVMITAVFFLVASGKFYAMAGEGRTIGLGEEPLWFPHAAVRFAGEPGMPPRLLSFHDGYAALYEYHNGPDRKVFVDARLEVVGPELYERYIELGRRIREDEPGWPRELDAAERPAVLVGHAGDAILGASILANPAWRCVWFDPMVAVYVHRSYADSARLSAHVVDLGARHFAPDPATDPHGIPALHASAEALWKYAQTLQVRGRPDLARPLVLLGLDYARRICAADPASVDGWKLSGKLEMVREPLAIDGPPVPRYRLPLDPVHDLSAVRATYDLRRAHAQAPRDFLTLFLLKSLYEARGMDEAALPVAQALARIPPINPDQARFIASAGAQLRALESRLGPPPPADWENSSALDKAVTELLARGRARSAAELLEAAYPPERRPWEVTDRLGTLWLHLGEPARARAAWEQAVAPPEAMSGLRLARLAVTSVVEGDWATSRRLYREALTAAADLFEAHYGLAVLEQDAGHAAAAQAAANAATEVAPGAVARSAAGAIATLVRPYTSEGRDPSPPRPRPDIRGVDTPVKKRGPPQNLWVRKCALRGEE
jgi:tetratricopeptide (TPR) repeat protein